MALEDFARGAVGAVEPFGEFREFDSVLDADVCNGDHGASLSNTRYPVVAAKGEERLSDGFVQRRGRHFDGMGNIVEVLENDAAGTKGHWPTLSYSLFVRHKKWHK